MPVDHIRYDILAQEALRGMVRTVLSDAARKGLPGEHHFFISFDTRAEGVRLSTRMREQYPEEMTIVLQHQFWDLKVSEDSFEVGLSFNGVAERLSVPFAAIKSFVDPSAHFSLQFEEIAETANDAGTPPAKSKMENKSENRNEKSAGKTRRSRQELARQELAAGQEATRAAPARTAATRTVPSIPQAAASAKPAPAGSAPDPTTTPPDGKPDKPDKPSRGADVVRLDRFRKK
jgi:uncharacterized protein